MTEPLTLIEKILREQQETAADVQRLVESEKQVYQADIEEMQKKQSEISELIEQIKIR